MTLFQELRTFELIDFNNIYFYLKRIEHFWLVEYLNNGLPFCGLKTEISYNKILFYTDI